MSDSNSDYDGEEAAEPEPLGARTLFPGTYERLRQLAMSYVRAEQSKRLIQATALVHEAFVRMTENDRSFANENEFLAVAATQMRHVLVDYARRARAQKRGGGRDPVTFDSRVLDANHRSAFDLLDVDDALSRLCGLDARQGRLAELHLFGGISIEEAAPMLDISPRTAFNDWRAARAWLLKELAP